MITEMCTSKCQWRYMCNKDYCYSKKPTAVASSVARERLGNHNMYGLPYVTWNNNSCTMWDLKRDDVLIYFIFCTYTTIHLFFMWWLGTGRKYKAINRFKARHSVLATLSHTHILAWSENTYIYHPQLCHSSLSLWHHLFLFSSVFIHRSAYLFV